MLLNGNQQKDNYKEDDRHIPGHDPNFLQPLKKKKLVHSIAELINHILLEYSGSRK